MTLTSPAPGNLRNATPNPLLGGDAVVYQVYLRSFRDSDGDGVGDLAGLRESLAQIADLGCDAIWLNPCYASPQRDHGYDISDYRAIDPTYGTLADFDALVTQAHDLGLRVLMDMVANHCSSQHRWFQAALTSAPGSRERARFLFRDGRGTTGELPPNNWESVFGGPAWTRVTEPDGRPGQWYFHAFDPSQPDFDWRNPEVAAEFSGVLRFWYDRGVDGFRIDVAHGMVKAAELPDHAGGGHNHAMWDQPEVHDIYRAWRALGDSYDPPKYLVGEVWLPSQQLLGAYLRPDELHQAFDFGLLVQPWDAGRLRAAINTGLQVAGRAPAWALANHDVHRTATRYGQQQSLEVPPPTDMISAARRRGPVDLQLGTTRARAAAGLLLALPGAAFLYQGEELGLPEVLDLADEARQDPIWLRSGGTELGRDGCRVPLPWTSTGPSLGFSPPASAPPWLPQPAWFAGYARDAQQDDPASTLTVYRQLLHHRRTLFGPDATLRWLDDATGGLLAFTRGQGACVVNLTDHPREVPPSWPLGQRVLCTEPVADDSVLP
ncbi:MAG: glycoside hydrolase family 13 protein, partial [Propionicimonas sp.]|nr:glycoside hydrolase family 13 protein [Propionicimonas sp.]